MSHAANEVLTRWLANEQPEEVIEPDLPIIDPHHHLGIGRITARNLAI